jgi:hypothetical protein
VIASDSSIFPNQGLCYRILTDATQNLRPAVVRSALAGPPAGDLRDGPDDGDEGQERDSSITRPRKYAMPMVVISASGRPRKGLVTVRTTFFAGSGSALSSARPSSETPLLIP